MFDIHSHLLPAIDDGASDLAVALDMARAYVEQGVISVVCTPHILPGVFQNTGSQILQAVAQFQQELAAADIPLQVLSGADNHIVPDFAAQIRAGHLLTVAGSRYVLVEPPHHVAPPRIEDAIFAILVQGYVPILTHPERLSWIESKYDVITRLAERGVLMQLTAGSLRGAFGRRPRYWAERMLSEGVAHVLATDTHDLDKRYPDLREGRETAARIVGDVEAELLTFTRPHGIILNRAPSELQLRAISSSSEGLRGHDTLTEAGIGGATRGLGDRLRRLLG